MKGVDLHRLVHSLDKAESDRVIQNAGRADKKRDQLYITLFKDLLATPNYASDEAFQTAFSEAKYFKSIHKVRDYLLEAILDALRSMRRRDGEEKAPDARVRERIEDAQLLRSKQLYDASFDRLMDAYELAKEHQYLELLLEVLKLQRTHLGEQADPARQEQLTAVIHEIREVGTAIHAACSTMAIRELLFAEFRQPRLDDEARLKLFVSCSSELDGLAPLCCEWLEPFTNFHLARFLLFVQRNDLQSAWSAQHAVYLKWRENPEYCKVRRTQHIKLLNNFLTTSIQARQSEDFIEALTTLERHPGTTPDEIAESEQNYAYIRLQYFLSRSDWANALEIETAFNKKPNWATVKALKPRLLVFYMSFARLHFVLGNFKKSEQSLKKLDSENDTKGWGYWRLEAEVIRLLIMFEQASQGKKSHDDMQTPLENKVRSVLRLFKKVGDQPEYIRIFVNGIKQIVKMLPKPEQHAWKKLHERLKSHQHKFNDDSSGQMFLAWIQSKMENRPVSEILSQHFPKFPG